MAHHSFKLIEFIDLYMSVIEYAVFVNSSSMNWLGSRYYSAFAKNFLYTVKQNYFFFHL